VISIGGTECTSRNRGSPAQSLGGILTKNVGSNAELEQALDKPGADRDRVLSGEGEWSARDCIEAAANARYEAKKQSAQKARDEKVQRAQEELFKRLGEQEAEDRRHAEL